jgi:anti-anti-sigma factor
MSVSGELDALSADLLRTAVADVLRRHRPERIDMDLHGVTFLDSAGIRALLLCQSDAQRAGSRVTLSRARPGVHRVLEITGLLDHFGLGRSGRSYDAVTTFRPVAQ